MCEFNERLKLLRKNKGVSQKVVAVAIGISERNYQNFEYGEYKPSFENLIALADYFDITLDYLMGRTDD